MKRRFPLWAVPALLACIVIDSGAQPYPSKPVRLIVGTAPAGGTDTLARAVAQKLTDSWGQQMIVDNRPGAGGLVGAETAAKAAPDGYTLLMGGSAYVGIATLNSKLPYDPIRDVSTVMLIGATNNVLAVHPSVPARTVPELVALAKAKPGQLNYASGGPGSALHLAAELFKDMTGTNLTHIPYKGGVPAVSAVVSGEVQMVFGSVTTTMPMTKVGRMRALAVTGSQRSVLLPELPTISESGVRGYEATNWYGLLAPARTPKPIIAKLNADLWQIVKAPDFRERMLSSQGIEPIGGTPEEFAAYLKSELTKWGRIVKQAGLRPD